MTKMVHPQGIDKKTAVVSIDGNSGVNVIINTVVDEKGHPK
jgi:hypothetical protein